MVALLDMDSRFDFLKQTLIQKMSERGADTTSRLKQAGVDLVRLASNESQGGEDALILHADGTWSRKIAMSGYNLGNANLNTVLAEYASILDLGFQLIRDSEQEEQKKAYLTDNRARLLGGILFLMEQLVFLHIGDSN